MERVCDLVRWFCHQSKKGSTDLMFADAFDHEIGDLQRNVRCFYVIVPVLIVAVTAL
jgi:hypothetical protein